jgi:hypothetical protein
MYWNGWPWDRMVILFVAAAFLLVGIQVTLFHYRQNFHHKAMWAPVIAAPLFFVVGIIFSFYNIRWVEVLFQWCMWLGILDGLIGFYYHFRGVGIRVGGWTLRNFLIGPPIILPVVFTAVSALGLVALYWR